MVSAVDESVLILPRNKPGRGLFKVRFSSKSGRWLGNCMTRLVLLVMTSLSRRRFLRFLMAKDRLVYIANLTEQAACKVLSCYRHSQPLQEQLEGGAAQLASKWDALFDNKMGRRFQFFSKRRRNNLISSRLNLLQLFVNLLLGDPLSNL